MRGDVDVALVVTPGDGVMSGYQVCLGEDQSCKKYFSFYIYLFDPNSEQK